MAQRKMNLMSMPVVKEVLSQVKRQPRKAGQKSQVELHPKREEIEIHLLEKKIPLTKLSKKYGLTVKVLSTYRKHLAPVFQKMQENWAENRAEQLEGRVDFMYDESKDQFLKAKGEEDKDHMRHMMGMVARSIELGGNLAGLQEQSNIPGGPETGAVNLQMLIGQVIAFPKAPEAIPALDKDRDWEVHDDSRTRFLKGELESGE